jgi:Fe-S-cluster containining protein
VKNNRRRVESERRQEEGPVNVAADTTRESPCLGCAGYCCWQNLINLCGYDIWAIAANLHLKPTDFVAFAELNDENPYNFNLDSSDRAYCLALRMRELPDGSRRCIFNLELPNDQIRCGIYPFRPIACRAYPLAFFGEEVMVKPWALCPEGAWDKRQPDLNYWREELGRHDMEFSIYACIVGNWNKMATKQPRLENLNFVPFLDFLMSIYGSLETVRRKVPAEAWPEIWKQWRCYTARGLNPLLLKSNGTARIANWAWWLENIRKAIVTASRDIRLQTIELEKSREEIVL